MVYAQIISETQIRTNAPRIATIGDRTVCGELPEDYLNSLGWYRLVPPGGVEPLPEGYHYESHYTREGNTVQESYVAVPDAPTTHTYKRSYLAQWLYANGKWEAFKQLLNVSADASFYWETSTEFDSDHPNWDQIFSGVKQGLHLTDEEAEAFLAAGEHGVS